MRIHFTETVTPFLNRLERNLRDKSPLWREIRDKWLIQTTEEVFRTNGKGTWKRTQRPNPILRDTRDLFKSYTQQGAKGNISDIRANKFTWGSNLPYARIHEEGIGITARPVLEFVKQDADRDQALQNLTDNYVQRLINASNK